MESREIFQKKLEAKLDGWRAEIDRLKAKADKAGADARSDYYEQVDELKKKQKQAEAKLHELKSAGEGAWNEMKGGMEAAWKNLGDAVERATSKFDQ